MFIDYFVHPSASVYGDVMIGAGTIVGPNAVILGPVNIGSNCWIGPNAIIGTPAEDVEMMVKAELPRYPNYFAEIGQINEMLWNIDHGEGVVIGHNTVIREQVTIHQGTVHSTIIGDNCFVMNKSHVGHDCVIGNNVRISPSAMIGGHCWIDRYSNIGMAATIHQNIRIGFGAMIGMNAAVVKGVLPYSTVVGVPAKFSGMNWVMAKKLEVSEDSMRMLEKSYNSEAHPPSEFVSMLAEHGQWG